MNQDWFWEVPTGAIDGVNTTYILIRSFGELTLGVWRNGVLGQRGLADEGGWIETDPDGGVFDMLTPLQLGDRLRVFYADSGMIEQMNAVLISATVRAPRVQATLSKPLVLAASISAPQLSGLLSMTQSVKAVVRVVRVSATVKACS